MIWLVAALLQPAATPDAYDAISDITRVFAALMRDHLHGAKPADTARRAIDAMITGTDVWTRRIKPTDATGSIQGIRCLKDRGVVRLRVPRFDGAWAGRWLRDCPGLDENLPILLDLRGNPGGSVADALALADLFIQDGELLIEERRDAAPFVHRARPSRVAFAALVVLVDGGTASAAEMLAAALRQRGVAYIAGTTTMGKATVQTAVHLSTGGYVLITTGRLKLPDGAQIHGSGLKPDGSLPKNPMAFACNQANYTWANGRCTTNPN